ncbi:MAG: hypothetical protein OHK0029_12740 [Armatimonadaceae bacterium]
MDRVDKYREIIHRILVEYRNWYQDPTDKEVDTEIIRDDVNGQYLLMRVGWHGETRIRRPLFYLRLRGSEIWIEEDWTEEGVNTALRDAGVPLEDIVQAYNPPFLRSQLPESETTMSKG